MRVVVAVLGLCGHKAALTGLANHSSAKGAVRRGRWGSENGQGGGGGGHFDSGVWVFRPRCWHRTASLWSSFKRSRNSL